MAEQENRFRPNTAMLAAQSINSTLNNMRISRIFTTLALQSNASVKLTDQEAHYLSKVLRLKPDAEVILFNGDGNEYTGKIVSLNKKQVEVYLSQQHSPTTESPLHSILALGISRGERMDYAIQKSTELGISEIVPLFTEHCEVKLQGERLLKRQAHWQQVAISACEQSGRTMVPKVHQPITIASWLSDVNCSTKFIFDHRQAQTLADLDLAKAEEVALLIGPEGGFSQKEVVSAQDVGFQGITLGPRVLRTETAPLAALTVLQYLWGDLL